MLRPALAASHSLVAALALAAQEGAEPTADALAKAIAEMRNLPAKLIDEEAEVRVPRIEAAWQTLIAAKGAGVAALLAEAAKLDAAKQRDDRFRLGAAAVVWEIGGLDRVADVIALWADADFAVKYDYAFHVAFAAARDGDERALPLLLALLRDKRGAFQVVRHAITLAWPTTHEFLWGPLGQKGLPALEKVLATATDSVMLESAICQLASRWHIAALPRLRTIASDPEHVARSAAVWALGRFGHPADFDSLCAGLTDADPHVVATHLHALAEFGDLRAVPRILPLLAHADRDVRFGALVALLALPTVDGLAAIAGPGDERDPREREWFAYGPAVFAASEDAWDAYRKLDPAARPAALAVARARAEERFVPKPGDRSLERADFPRLCEKWIAESRIHDEEHEWLEARHLLAITSAADVPLLLEVRGRLFRRLSDECLHEVELVDAVLRRLVRSQYRAEPGLCDRVMPAIATKPASK